MDVSTSGRRYIPRIVSDETENIRCVDMVPRFVVEVKHRTIRDANNREFVVRL